MKDTKPTVIYIIGDNRSGSTLLDYLLSSHPEAYSVGEIHHLQNYYNKIGVGKRQNWECNCGNQIENCDFWKDILIRSNFTQDTKTNIRSQYRESKLSYLNKYFLKKEVNQTILRNEKEGMEYANNILKLYKTVANVSNKKFIIDSSKSPLEAYYLSKQKKIDIKFILLKRDIWEVAFSKYKRLRGFDKDFKKYMQFKNKSIYKEILATSKIYKRNQIFSDFLNKNGNSVSEINYSNLTLNPKKYMTTVFKTLGMQEYVVPNYVKNRNNHSLHGSPSRKNESEIKPDKRWEIYYKRKPLALLFAKLLQS